MSFAVLQRVCLGCAVGHALASCTKSSDFPGAETEKWKNLHKGYSRIYNFLSVIFYDSFASILCCSHIQDAAQSMQQ